VDKTCNDAAKPPATQTPSSSGDDPSPESAPSAATPSAAEPTTTPCSNGANGQSCQNSGTPSGVFVGSDTSTCSCSCGDGFGGSNCQTEPTTTTTSPSSGGDNGDINTPNSPSPTSATTVNEKRNDPVKDRTESTTMIETDIEFDGMSAAEFITDKKEITKAIADTLEVHPSMLIVTVKSNRRRHLTANGDQVTLEVQIFVTPEKATAMEEKVMVVQTSNGSSALSNKIASAAGFDNALSASVSDPVTKINQTPPPAPQSTQSSATPSSSSDKEKKNDTRSWVMWSWVIGCSIALVFFASLALIVFRNKRNNASTRLKDNNDTGLEMGSAVAMSVTEGTNPTMTQISL